MLRPLLSICVGVTLFGAIKLPVITTLAIVTVLPVTLNGFKVPPAVYNWKLSASTVNVLVPPVLFNL